MKLSSYIFLLTLMISFVGCSTNDVTRSVEDGMVKIAGNKPAQFFHFTAPEYVNKWKFRHKDYEALSPLTKNEDWTKMGGWGGAYIGNSIAFSLRQIPRDTHGDNWISYAFNISTSTLDYSKWDEALSSNDIEFYRKNMPKRTDQYGKTKNINVHFETHGKENYPCLIWEEQWLKGVIKYIYSCDKYNSVKTKSKRIRIELIYQKVPTIPSKYKSLAKQYTYEDLQNRAKRVLDSLYIKDGWE